jgi:penicillin-binding protein 1A
MAKLENIVKLPQVSAAISRNYEYLGKIYTEYRINSSFRELPKFLIKAVISAEDKRFFFHKGDDLIALLRAIWKNLKHFAIVQGGSTITQQLARIAVLYSKKRTFKRKILELLAAIKIERIAAKEQILEAYLNAIYLGRNIFGVKAASWEYFCKNVSNLDLNESAYLAGLIRSPNKYSCCEALANLRKNRILELMYKNKYISRDMLIVNSEFNIKPRPYQRSFDDDYADHEYYLNYVKKYLLNHFKNLFPYRQMIIKTNFERGCQQAINLSLKEIASDYTEDRICCLILDKNSGGVKAIKNCIEDKSRYFNVAVNGYLQPGSTIKPFILAEAMRQGFYLESKFESKKLQIDLPTGKKWEVRNFNNIYRGIISLADALVYSDNSVFAQLILRLDIDKVKLFLKEVGLDVGVPIPAIATGATSKGLSPLQIASAYSVFSNKGNYLPPTPINELRSNNGEKLIESKVIPHYVLDSNIANEIDDVLKKVAIEGTGIFENYSIPNLRAKTGTTTSYSWYISYDEKYHLLTWTGKKNNSEVHKDIKQDVTFIPPRVDEVRYGRTKSEKAITAKQLAERIWTWLRLRNKLGDFSDVAEGINKFDVLQVTELEGYFMPWGKYGEIYH